MTASLVSFQGFTYKMTRVTFPNCFTSGVHLKLSYDCLVEWHFGFCFQQKWYTRVGVVRFATHC